jgi:cytidine deaminase
VTGDELMARALATAARAYAPYSGLRVGAAVLTAGGAVHAGANVENASYGSSLCAERAAVAAMVAADPADREIRAVAIAVADPAAGPCFPCGACRQVLHEFGCRDVLVRRDGAVARHALVALLPHPFGPHDLPPETGG